MTPSARSLLYFAVLTAGPAFCNCSVFTEAGDPFSLIFADIISGSPAQAANNSISANVRKRPASPWRTGLPPPFYGVGKLPLDLPRSYCFSLYYQWESPVISRYQSARLPLFFAVVYCCFNKSGSRSRGKERKRAGNAQN